MRRATLLLALLLMTPAIAHESLPIVVNIQQKSAEGFLVRLTTPAVVPVFARPEVALGVPCEDEALFGNETRIIHCAGGIGGVQVVLRYAGSQPAIPLLARVQWLSGETRTVLAPAGASSIDLPQPERAASVLREYVVLGIEHILGGYDHLLFLICLVLVAATPRRVLLTVTGFTLGHALTISLVALGVAGAPTAPVEAAIAASIVFLAAEVMRDRRTTLMWRYPALLSTGFGILHGLGFASALKAIGLPQTEKAVSLLGFNLGIEAGQLAVVAMIALAWRAVRALARTRDIVESHAQATRSALACSVGCVSAYWMIGRMLAL